MGEERGPRDNFKFQAVFGVQEGKDSSWAVRVGVASSSHPSLGVCFWSRRPRSPPHTDQRAPRESRNGGQVEKAR